MKLLNGKKLADKIKLDVQTEVRALQRDGNSVSLTVIQVGDNPASSTYVHNKEKACEYCGINSNVYKLPDAISEDQLLCIIDELNYSEEVDGILVQLPLPAHIDESKVIEWIIPEKDVDGFHPHNVGNLMIGKDTLVPCTTAGIIELLTENNIDIEGKHCVVVGRSNIVGKPTAIELLRHNGTVTVCHSKTTSLKEICREADILVCAIGKPKFFNKDYVKDGAVVIDVGIHRQTDGTLCGDVDFDDVKDIVSAITPVPGGVGAMTVAMLMKNCVQAAKAQSAERKR